MPMRQNLLHRGSSPHVRGALKQDVARLRTAGIIPACAGSTRSTMVFPVDKRDHPRMCGEHGRVVTVNGNVKGSSPHVRGAPAAVVVCHLVRGIIPACAGSTFLSKLSAVGLRDHPRMCGEHVKRLARGLRKRGSSPHVRGAPFRHGLRLVPFGIIPACAGSTGLLCVRLRPILDHPRMCGEHTSMIGFAAMTAGSSPHVRGAPGARRHAPVSRGIIPACAGSTMVFLYALRVSGDHPRMCGEHLRQHLRASRSWGSSPHVRGARLHPATLHKH